MQETILLGMRWIDLINLLAILAGPILAVMVDRSRQKRAGEKGRRLAVFRSLMRTRRHRLDPEHVGALNLIDLEFFGKTSVIRAFSSYMDHLWSSVPTTEDGNNRWNKRQEDLLVGLLSEMGKECGLKYDMRDLERRAYGPIGWEHQQETQQQNMAFLNELLAGKRALPITTMTQPPAMNAFPPPPEG